MCALKRPWRAISPTSFIDEEVGTQGVRIQSPHNLTFDVIFIFIKAGTNLKDLFCFVLLFGVRPHS